MTILLETTFPEVWANDRSAEGVDSGFPIVRFPFEGVVEVRIAAAKIEHETGREINREHERSPPSILSDMHVFVIAASVETVLIAAKNDMPERHRRRRTEERHAAS